MNASRSSAAGFTLIEALISTLIMGTVKAGAGAYSGTQAGSLIGYFAPILPFRQGRMAAYDDGTGVFRNNALTILYVPSTAAQTTIRDGMTSASSTITVNAESG